MTSRSDEPPRPRTPVPPNRVPRWSKGHAVAKLILQRLDGALDVADIAVLTGVAEDEIERTIAPLIASGFVAYGDTVPGSIPPSSSSPPPPIPEDQHRAISQLFARLTTIDHYSLLGVAATAEVQEIKRAYFALAKIHHPDRFFRKDVGTLKPKIEAIFSAMTMALDTLSNAEKRAAYDAYLHTVLKTRMARRNAEALERKREFRAAADVWARVVDELPTDAYLQNRYASALLRAGADLKTAKAAAIRATELDATRAEYRLTTASLYLAEGRDRSALRELEIACELDADRTDICDLAASIAARAYAKDL